MLAVSWLILKTRPLIWVISVIPRIRIRSSSTNPLVTGLMVWVPPVAAAVRSSTGPNCESESEITVAETRMTQ